MNSYEESTSKYGMPQIRKPSVFLNSFTFVNFLQVEGKMELESNGNDINLYLINIADA
jgi:hypothetical protein